MPFQFFYLSAERILRVYAPDLVTVHTRFQLEIFSFLVTSDEIHESSTETVQHQDDDIQHASTLTSREICEWTWANFGLIRSAFLSESGNKRLLKCVTAVKGVPMQILECLPYWEQQFQNSLDIKWPKNELVIVKLYQANWKSNCQNWPNLENELAKLAAELAELLLLQFKLVANQAKVVAWTCDNAVNVQAGSQTVWTGSRTVQTGSQTTLTGSQTVLTGSPTVLTGSQTVTTGSENGLTVPKQVMLA